MSNKLRPDQTKDGVALIIVLAFLVILVGIVLAFFSRTVTDRMVSNSDTGTVRAEAVGRSGLDIVVSGLRQEIVLTSTATTVGSGSNTTVLYTPNSPVYMVPIRSGTTGIFPDPIPNMVRRSMRSDGVVIGSGTITSNASPVNSGSDVSLNGRSVSPAIWNAHFLVPLSGTSGIAYDSTPVGSFSPPDWVLVNRAGPVIASTWNSNLANASQSNSNFIIGRYAYAIYDEGGLLNVNVAGYPSQTGTTQSGYKGVAAYADLTQLSGTLNGAPWAVSGSSVDSLVGWRNYTTVQPTGTFPAFTLSSTAATNYFTMVTTSTNGFMSLSGSLYNGATDQAFMSRQQLIQFSQSIGIPASALQYLGTFSRDLEQPSFVPNPGRPTVQSSGGPASSANAATFGTGNDAYGVDRSGTASADINPPFLQVRVTGTSFTRWDGSTANVGDPLIIKRFPLSRLSLLVTGATATQGQGNPIYSYFGLYRTSGTGPWLYNHGGSASMTAGTGILRLSDVAKLGREPDFFELLKAAINVGSIGKAALFSGNGNLYTTVGSAGYLQQAKDQLTALQILQIGANIIDQSKADNYPTRIQFSGNSNYLVSGVEDLPYLNQMRNWIMRTGTSGALGVVLLQPELWNPHSPGSYSTLSATSTPKNFRVRILMDPSATSNPLASALVDYNDNINSFDATQTCVYNTPATPSVPLTFNAGELNGYWGFREPTLLSQINTPASCGLSGISYTDYPAYTPNPSRQVTGFLVTTFPWYWAATGTSDVNYKIYFGDTVGASCMHYYLDYQDPYGNWITYNDSPFQFYEMQGTLTNTKISGTLTTLVFQEFSQSQFYDGGMTDPRTSRWGFKIGQYPGSIPMVGGSNANNEFCTYRPDAGISYGDHVGSRNDKGITGGGNNYGSAYRGFQHGYWAENSIRPTYQDPTLDPGDSGLRFIRDPDGVVRRAMGGYWSDTNNGGVTPSAATTPVIGLPMATGTSNGNYASRPTILHRPFQSVAELGYVFSDTPWHNLDFSFPESGYSALLDVFCINENSNTNGLVAGRVNLNTRQAPVLQALLAGTILDKDNLTTTPPLSGIQAAAIAAQLVARTSSGTSVLPSGTAPLPLMTRADLVGTWFGTSTPAAAKTALSGATPDPNAVYTGFSADIGTLPGISGTQLSLIPRQREAVMRALADAGSTRTWNLLIDLVAQSGRYPPAASNLGSFVVDGQQHYWLHVSIDRATGKVIDSQLEVVKQ